MHHAWNLAYQKVMGGGRSGPCSAEVERGLKPERMKKGTVPEMGTVPFVLVTTRFR
jgi:hypothetical protein